MKGQRWKTMVVEGRRGGREVGRGWCEKIVGFGRLFIGKVGQKRLGGHKCSQKT